MNSHAVSLDHLVGKGEQRRRHFEAKKQWQQKATLWWMLARRRRAPSANWLAISHSLVK
jgi:hypothetical protein